MSGRGQGPTKSALRNAVDELMLKALREGYRDLAKDLEHISQHLSRSAPASIFVRRSV